MLPGTRGTGGRRGFGQTSPLPLFWGIRLRQTLKDYSSFYKKTRRRVTRNSGAVVARGLSLYD